MNKEITIDEAIYCMQSYLPETDMSDFCERCPHYSTVQLKKNLYTCRSSEAHRLAIKALEYMKLREQTIL